MSAQSVQAEEEEESEVYLPWDQGLGNGVALADLVVVLVVTSASSEGLLEEAVELVEGVVDSAGERHCECR